MEQASSARPRRRSWRKSALLIVAIAVACFAAAVAVLLLTTGDSDDQSGEAAGGQPSILSEEELRAFGRDRAVPVYWAGPRAQSEYELTRPGDGRVFIRYLPEGAEAGDPRPRFLTVASYAQPNAYQFLQAQGRRPGWTSTTTRSGALVANAESRPTSVYFAFEDAELQVEVYDPDVGRARQLVLDGEIRRLQ